MVLLDELQELGLLLRRKIGAEAPGFVRNGCKTRLLGIGYLGIARM